MGSVNELKSIWTSNIVSSIKIFSTILINSCSMFVLFAWFLLQFGLLLEEKCGRENCVTQIDCWSREENYNNIKHNIWSIEDCKWAQSHWSSMKCQRIKIIVSNTLMSTNSTN